MNVLVIGNGGREHAITWRLAHSRSVSEVYASPGNPGMAKVAQILPPPSDLSGFVSLAQQHGIGLTVVGPEAPLVEGIVDAFQAAGLRIVGPTQAAARLEGSKIFAKEFLRRHNIPTARSIEVSAQGEASEALTRFSLPVVIKADGLAAGKGVIVAGTKEEAEEAVVKLGPKLVIEEFLEGEEVSFIGLSDGRNTLSFPPSQDHKRIFEGDEGPNTGGMGAYCDERILTPTQTDEIIETIMLPTIRGMERDRVPFTGFLFGGLMMTANGPRVLEFNVRSGDPETQAILYGAEGDFLEFLQGDVSALTWKEPSVCVVIAAQGYPNQPRTGDQITGIPAAEAAGTAVFQAGTALNENKLVTNGGRVLGITAKGPTLNAAIASAYAGAQHIRFEGMHFRRDIGQKGLKRW